MNEEKIKEAPIDGASLSSIYLFFTFTQRVFFNEQLDNLFYSLFSGGSLTVCSTVTVGVISAL